MDDSHCNLYFPDRWRLWNSFRDHPSVTSVNCLFVSCSFLVILCFVDPKQQFINTHILNINTHTHTHSKYKHTDTHTPPPRSRLSYLLYS